MNRFAWNMRYESPVEIPGAFYASNGPEGPIVLPGTYTLKLTAAGKTQTQPLVIKMDPRLKLNEADLAKQFELSRKIADSITQLHEAVNQIRTLRSDMQTVKARIGGDGKHKELLDAMEQLDKKMSPVEEELTQVKLKSSEGNLRYPNKLNEQFDSLSHTVDQADNAPSQPEQQVYDMLNAKLQQQLAAWKQVATADVPALNQLIQKADIPAVSVRSAGE